MKWSIVHTSAKQEIYELWHNDKKLLTLDFHPFTNSARIEYADEKRVFLIRKEGFLRNKIVLRNEYGIRIGQLGNDKSNLHEGYIELNDERFSYIINNDPAAELTIYRDNKEEPLVVCGLKADDVYTSVSLTRGHELSPSLHFLLMSLCWYMFLPVAKENRLEYAS